jgi:hypothetical protein
VANTPAVIESGPVGFSLRLGPLASAYDFRHFVAVNRSLHQRRKPLGQQLQQRDRFGGHGKILADDELTQSDRQPLARRRRLFNRDVSRLALYFQAIANDFDIDRFFLAY